MDDLLLTPADGATLLAARLRAARKRKGWTQEELATRSGLSVATVARMEQRGHGQLHSLLAMATALGHLRDFESVMAEPAPRTLDELRRSLQ